ncbi:MAG TPA: hypothetical protein VHF45_11930 [Thermoleophilaceae bacterium]|nr:hypothetical protein [Thermoleophilaceae bacterium]
MPVEIGGFPDAKTATPRGCDTSYVENVGLRAPAAGRRADVPLAGHRREGRPFRIDWRVAAGLDGKARAVGVGGGPAPSGSFAGSISAKPPQARVAEDGETVVTGSR